MSAPPTLRVAGPREHGAILAALRARIHRHLPAWHAPPAFLELDRFDPRTSFWKAREHAHLVVEDAAGPAGRLSVFWKPGAATAEFGAFDATRDPRVADQLFRAARAWAGERGAATLRGPFYFSMHEEVGLLTRGFHLTPAIMMAFNPDYYPGLFEAAGLRSVRSFRTFRYRLAESHDAVVAADHDASTTDRVRSFDKARLEDEVAALLAIYNDAFAENWGFTPLSARACRRMVDEFLLVGDPILIRVAEVEGEPAGFLLCLPDLNGFFRRVRWAPGPLKMLLLAGAVALKRIRDCRVVTLAVRPRFRGRGLARRMIASLAREAAPAGYRDAELSYVDTGNRGMDHLMSSYSFGSEKEYRIYEGPVARPGPGRTA